MDSQNTIKEMMERLAQPGRVSWIGLRPERRAKMRVVEEVEALEDCGLEGDRAADKPGKKRQVTLIMGEHLDATGMILGRTSVDPSLTRRNIVTRGINLLSLKDRRFQIGDAVFELTGPAHPCSRMEENLGEGGYNAMRGHGGWCAKVIRSGTIRVGDAIQFL